ncbi:hypothetical protein MTP99_017908 [Tenebrio molitor]|nr:hypothetical protein MTP99_017908 [Tenebrio molitor]
MTAPSLLAKALAVYLKVYSLRLKASYYVNRPSYISIMLKILKSLMKPKIFQRIQVHQDEEVLKQIFSREALAKDYGGEGPSLDELNCNVAI